MSSDPLVPDSSSRKKRPSGGQQSRVAKGLAPALILVVCAGVSALMVHAAGNEAPSPAQWEAAATYVREARGEPNLAQPDLIVFAPSWIDPVGRQFLGDQMDIAMAARMDASRFGRIWELSIRDARAAETTGLPQESTKNFGPLRLRVFKQVSPTVTEDFTAGWKEAALSGQMQGRPNLSLQEVGFEPHRCIKVVPKPNKSVSMRFEAASLGNEIVAYVGLADVFTRRDVRDPGKLEILVNDTIVATKVVTVDNGWQRVVAATSPGTGSVEFRLSAVGEGARDRRICFAAEARQ